MHDTIPGIENQGLQFHREPITPHRNKFIHGNIHTRFRTVRSIFLFLFQSPFTTFPYITTRENRHLNT